jgi:hypothetical protein
MDANQTDAPEVLETQEVAEETTETPEAEEPELTPEVIADLKAKAAKAEELEKKNKQLFERAKKAEATKEIKGVEEAHQALSTKDVLYLAKADVHEDDVNEVLEWAKFKKISVSEAHKQLTATLQVRAEERKSAETANVSNVRRGPTTLKPETLLENAKSGKLPETDADIARLMDAKLRAK